MIHPRIQEFPSGGGGGGGGGGGSRSIWHIKKSSDNVFIFFRPQLISQKPVVTFKENYYLPRFQWVWNIFQGGGGSNFLQGGPIAFSL